MSEEFVGRLKIIGNNATMPAEDWAKMARECQTAKRKVETLEQENAELKARLERLRGVVETAITGVEWYKDTPDFNGSDEEFLAEARRTLDMTPAQPLAAHDKEMRESCAKLCDEEMNQANGYGEFDIAFGAEICAKAIRAMED